MGFVLNRKRIDRVRVVLDTVLSVNGQRVIIPTKTPSELSYALYEALNTARELPQDDPDYKYAKIKEDYRICHKPDSILFKPKTVDIQAAIIESVKTPKTEPIVLPELTDVFHVVGAAIQHKGRTLIFPNAALSTESFAQLKKWVDKNDYSYTEGPLTLTKNAPDSQISNSG